MNHTLYFICIIKTSTFYIIARITYCSLYVLLKHRHFTLSYESHIIVSNVLLKHRHFTSSYESHIIVYMYYQNTDCLHHRMNHTL